MTDPTLGDIHAALIQSLRNDAEIMSSLHTLLVHKSDYETRVSLVEEMKRTARLLERAGVSE